VTCLKILLVDDDPDMILLLSDALEGHDVRYASNLSDAARMVQVEGFDAYIVDYRLPPLSGAGFAEVCAAEAPAMVMSSLPPEYVLDLYPDLTLPIFHKDDFAHIIAWVDKVRENKERQK